MYVRRSDIKVPDEYIAEALVIILTGVNRDVFTMLIENFHDQAEPDYFGTCPEDRHDLHIKFVYFPAARKNLISSLADARRSRSSSIEMLLTRDEYSVCRAWTTASVSR